MTTRKEIRRRRESHSLKWLPERCSVAIDRGVEIRVRTSRKFLQLDLPIPHPLASK